MPLAGGAAGPGPAGALAYGRLVWPGRSSGIGGLSRSRRAARWPRRRCSVFLAPGARFLGPQVTALPPFAAYHDLRWLFAFNQPWFGFTGVLVLLIAARSVVDAVLVMLAWPREPALPRPRFLTSLLSCAVLTVVTGLVMSPVVTLMFGVALLPFSWPYLAAVPILVGTAVALSQG